MTMSSRRVPYALVAMEMEKLLSISIDLTDVAAMENHCNLLRAYVKSCGWEVDDYVLRMMNSPSVSRRMEKYSIAIS